MPLPVWVRVSSSNVSSSVPKPPGRQTNARLSFTSISLRVKKYFMLTYFSSPAMIGLAPCSNGRRIDTPMLFSRPAPSIPACMMPGPAPVMTIHPFVGEAGGDLAGLLVERVVVLDPRRSEDRHLRRVAVGREHRERVAHLGDGGGGDLEVEVVGTVEDQPERLGEELLGDAGVGWDSQLVEQPAGTRAHILGHTGWRVRHGARE